MLLVAVAALFLQGTPVKESESTGIQFFEGTWEQAMQTAKQENKLIFLDAYASWCGPCKLLKRNVFPQSEVGDYFNEHFVSVAIDMEKGIGPKLAQQYRITAYPTLFFLDGNGNIVQKAMGYHNANQLLQLAKSIAHSDT